MQRPENIHAWRGRIPCAGFVRRIVVKAEGDVRIKDGVIVVPPASSWPPEADLIIKAAQPLRGRWWVRNGERLGAGYRAYKGGHLTPLMSLHCTGAGSRHFDDLCAPAALVVGSISPR